MKKFLAILILIFTLQTPSQADDIRDFQIEGMSIGDSLLDYFSKEEIINKKKKDWFNNNEFSVSTDFELPSFKTYKSVQIGYKTEDKKFTIMGIEGYIYFKKDKGIETCYKKQNKIIKELSDLFPNAKKGKKATFKHPNPASNNIITNISFFFDPTDLYGDKVMVGCVNRKDLTQYNNLVIILRSKKYSKFLRDKAYK